MQKVTPCIWYDDAAEDAAEFYISVFGGGNIKEIARYSTETPSEKPLGSVMTVLLQVHGQEFLLLNGGPVFKPNPSISFFVNLKSADEVEAIWNKLAEGGQVLMPLQSYPYSDKYGWVQDKYGVSWQVNLCSDEPGILPFLMYTGDQYARAEEAAEFYCSLLPDSELESVTYHGEEAAEFDEPDAVINVTFTLAGRKFMAMDSGYDHKFDFDEGVSLIIYCDTQQEVDRLWNAITANGGEESVCGWCRDRFGVSWQITPRVLAKMVSDPDPDKAARAMKAMMEMKKLDIAALEAAYAGKKAA